MQSREQDDLLETLKARFEKHMHRHEGIAGTDVRARLDVSPEALMALGEIESTGGEPDVIAHDAQTG